jgi:alpha-glucosidase
MKTKTISRPALSSFHQRDEHVYLKNQKWWKKAVIYQIYPRSFQDSNGDGVGDLRGVISRLDYLKSLNIDAVWLSPIYPSPMLDFGYDISDYTDIHPLFGSMDDFDRLLVEVHKRGMRLLLDFVPNHTSSHHPWFIESKSSRDNPKRDYYIWKDPGPDGGPPNNWRSVFGGPAWTFDEQTGQYYLHQFLKDQPELNYRHPDVFPKMMENVRFWLEKGVDGFRVDVIWLLVKDEMLRDEPINPDWDGVNPWDEYMHVYTQNVDGIHDLIREMRQVFDDYPDRMMVGEIYLPYEELMKYYGQELDECHLPFNFKLISIEWNAHHVRHFVNQYESMLLDGCWPNWVLGNHDQHRVGSRIGNDHMRVANMLLLTLRGTPTTYYGEELGMVNAEIPYEKMRDPPALKQPQIAHIIGRDFERSPMQWDGESPNAGFCPSDVEPWLPLSQDWRENNVSNQEKSRNSMLKMYRKLTYLRRREPALSVGRYRSLTFNNKDLDDQIFCYYRDAHPSDYIHLSKSCESATHPDIFLVMLNFGGKNFENLNIYEKLTSCEEQRLHHSGILELSTEMDREGKIDLTNVSLRPHEGLVIRCSYPIEGYALLKNTKISRNVNPRSH